MAAVLIVDDDAAIREALHELLEDAGYDVREAADGVVALRALRSSEEPLVALMDLKMPRMDGHELLGTVAADPHLARRHAYILVTANADTQTPAFARLLSQLAVPVVAKPFEIDDILSLVAAAAGKVAAPVSR